MLNVNFTEEDVWFNMNLLHEIHDIFSFFKQFVFMHVQKFTFSYTHDRGTLNGKIGNINCSWFSSIKVKTSNFMADFVKKHCEVE